MAKSGRDSWNCAANASMGPNNFFQDILVLVHQILMKLSGNIIGIKEMNTDTE